MEASQIVAEEQQRQQSVKIPRGEFCPEKTILDLSEQTAAASC